MHRGDPVNILLVDDREENLLVLEAILESNTSYRLYRATSAREAIEKFKQNDFAVVLLDVQMPEMDGFEAAQLIRELAPSKTVPIIFVTALNDDKTHVHKGYASGAVDFLYKPLDPIVIRSKVSVFVELYRSQQIILQQEKRLSQIQKRTLEERLGTVVNSAPIILWALDKDGTYTLSQGKGLAAAGFKPGELEGQSFYEVYENAPQLVAKVKYVLDGNPLTSESEYVGLWYRTEYSPLRGPNDEILGLVAVSLDITKQKLAETELREAAEKTMQLNEELQRAVQARDELLSVTSHELRTPITSIKLQLEIAKRGFLQNQAKTIPPEKVLKSLDSSLGQVNKLTALIENLLDFSRISGGKLTYNFQDTDLTPLIEEAVDRLIDAIQLAKCELKLHLPKSARVTCDPIRIEQVVINLITNATKYGAGSPIHIEVDSRPSTVVIRCTDFGMGIEKDKQDKIFDRFERAVSCDNVSGFGLGLYITRQIVEAHQGKITVESELGKGSTFVVEMPLVPAVPAN